MPGKILTEVPQFIAKFVHQNMSKILAFYGTQGNYKLTNDFCETHQTSTEIKILKEKQCYEHFYLVQLTDGENFLTVGVQAYIYKEGGGQQLNIHSVLQDKLETYLKSIQ